MAEVIYPSVELALALGSRVHAMSLFAGLALALSGMSCESPARPKRSRQAGSEIHRQTRQREFGAGWIKSAGPVLSSEKCIVVVRRISLL